MKQQCALYLFSLAQTNTQLCVFFISEQNNLQEERGSARLIGKGSKKHLGASRVTSELCPRLKSSAWQSDDSFIPLRFGFSCLWCLGEAEEKPVLGGELKWEF